MVECINCKVLSWESIHAAAKSVANQIKKSGFLPDYVVAIARGGVVPARLLCDELHLKNFISIKADHWGITASKDGKATLRHGTLVDLSSKKVLLVDDITDTGESMQISKEYLESLNPEVVKTVAFYHLTGSNFTPDFYGKEEEWSWMIWPWNYKEDVVNLMSKFINEGITDAESLQTGMLDKFKVYLEEDEVKEVLSHINYLNSR